MRECVASASTHPTPTLEHPSLVLQNSVPTALFQWQQPAKGKRASTHTHFLVSFLFIYFSRDARTHKYIRRCESALCPLCLIYARRGVHASRSLARSSIESRLFIIAIQIGYNRKREKASKKKKTLAVCFAPLRAQRACKLPLIQPQAAARAPLPINPQFSWTRTHTLHRMYSAPAQNEERSRSKKGGIENTHLHIDGVRFYIIYASVKSLGMGLKLLAANSGMLCFACKKCHSG
jgi:hypothetical protein